MTNGKTHVVVGGLTGLAVVLADVGVAAFFVRLPDILEPSVGNPHHSHFFHSVAVLGATTYTVKKTYEWQPHVTGRL